MRRIGLSTSLAVVIAGGSLFACSSSLCSGTHTLTGLSAVYTGCSKHSGGGYTTANLSIDCSQTLASGSGTGSDTAAAAHQWVIINQNTQQSVFVGSQFPIPQNGNGYACNLACDGTGGNSPLVAPFNHETTLCQVSVGTPYYVSHRVYYGVLGMGDNWTSSNTIQSGVITP
jgi:hypothetical protein